MNGDPFNGGRLSFLPGQRLSRCTCKGESHPGPVHPDGTYVGRSAPEIDVFEALVRMRFEFFFSGWRAHVLYAQVNEAGLFGQVSQSAQWAVCFLLFCQVRSGVNDWVLLQPFNQQYVWQNTTANMIIPNATLSQFNTYVGGATQQTTSAVALTDTLAYEVGGGFSIYGFEVSPSKSTA